jgi:hypothetical protein
VSRVKAVRRLLLVILVLGVAVFVFRGILRRSPVMQTLFTIGTQGRHDDDFIAVLKANQIDAVIDIRLRNEGRYYRFASGKHIKALCETNGIAYRHETRFSPTGEMLDQFKADQDWPGYERAYRALVAERDMPRIWAEVAGGYLRPCLMCADWGSKTCRTLSSSVGIEKPTDASRHVFKMPMSRVTSGDRVRTLTPQPCSRSASKQPWVNLYWLSAGW